MAAASYLNLYARNHGLQPVVIRASNAYSPFQGNLGIQGIVATHLDLAMAGRPLEIWGDGSIVRDFIYVIDLTRLCLLALESQKVGIYNGGSGVGTSIRQVAETVRQITGHR